MKKKFISILLSMVMLFCNLNFAYASQTTSKEPPLEFADDETMQVENRGAVTVIEEYDGYTIYSNGLMVIDGTGRLGNFPSYADYENSSGESIRVYVNKVTVKDGVTYLWEGAFSGWDKLTSVSLPDSLTELSDYLFSKNTGLTTINIPAGVKTIGNNTFSGCSNLTNVNISGNITSVGSSAFYNCSKLTSINFPYGLKSIDSYAFKGCNNLVSIYLPESLISIGYLAFEDCSNLISINLPDSLTSIGNSAFLNCTSLTQAHLSNSLTTINHGLFYNCSSLSSITIPDNVTVIEDSAFEECTSLTEVSLPSSLTKICNNAFYNCSNMKFAQVNLPLSLEEIEWSAFKGCTSITDIGLPQYFDIDNIFECDSLINITLLQSVTDVGKTNGYYGIFKNCNNLQNIFVDENNQVFESYDGALYDKGKTELIDVPKAKESISLPDSMINISHDAFENCSKIKSIVFPKVMDRIEISMDGCTSLSDLTIYPDLGFFHIDFGNCNALKIHCAKDSDAYRFTGYPTGSEIICDIPSLYPEESTEVVSSQTTEETTVNYSAKGDINKDGIISDKDATLIIKYIYGVTSAIFYDLDAADANGDGIIDGLDAIWVLNNQGKTSNPTSSTTDSIAEETTKSYLEQITT